MVASTLLVQADLSGTVFGGAPTWTDITRFVRLVDGITITSWRQDALSQISPTTFGLTLDNADLPNDATAPSAGRFTPGLSTSPWTGRLLPGVRVQILETVGGTTYNLADGFALDWTAQYDDQGAFSTCVVNCTDILAWMGTQQPLHSIQVEETLLDAPKALYKLSEAAGSTAAGNSSPVSQVSLAVAATKYGGDAATFGGDGGVISGDTALILNPNLSTAAGNDLKGHYLTGPPIAGVTPTADYTFELWASTRNRTAGQTGSLAILAKGTRTFGLGWNFGYCAIGYRQAGGGPPAGNYYGPGNLVDVTGSGWHHLALTYVAATNTYTFYIDGAVAGTSVDATATAWTPDTLFIGYDPVNGNCFRGSIQGVVICSTALSAVRIQAHYSAGLNALAGERTDQRISRLLSYRPNLGSVLDTGRGAIGVQDTSGVTLQDALFVVGKAEGGLVYADGQGRIVLLNRGHLYDPATAATFDAAADLQPDFAARIDLQQLINDYQVDYPSGPSQRRTDATSQAAFGVKATADTLLLNSDRDAADVAGWVIANQKTPSVRAPQVTVDVLTETSTAQAQAALARGPLDRIALSNLPSSAPPTDVMVQGRTISIGHDRFDVSFFTSNLPRKTLRADAVASANTKLDNGLVVPW